MVVEYFSGDDSSGFVGGILVDRYRFEVMGSRMIDVSY